MVIKPKTQFTISLAGTILIALCCFTPVLVILLGVLGLAGLVGYLDYVLLPALAIFILLTVYSYFKYRNLNHRSKSMSQDCCEQTSKPSSVICPINNQQGKRVKMRTLTSLLNSESLLKVADESSYFFCEDQDCRVVYFNEASQVFTINDLKVPVFQKDMGGDVPVCYCFNFTRNKIDQNEHSQPGSVEDFIRQKIKDKACSCETTNPQGSCCLKNVHQVINLAST